MIRACGQNSDDGRQFLIIGLSRRNCELLLKGAPIPFDASAWGVDAHIFIMAGETEETITEDLRKAGVEFNPKDQTNDKT